MELHVQNHFWVVHPLLPNTMQLIWHESSAAMYSSFDSPGQLDSHPLGSTDTSRYAGRTDSPTRSQVKRLDGIEIEEASLITCRTSLPALRLKMNFFFVKLLNASLN